MHPGYAAALALVALAWWMASRREALTATRPRTFRVQFPGMGGTTHEASSNSWIPIPPGARHAIVMLTSADDATTTSAADVGRFVAGFYANGNLIEPQGLALVQFVAVSVAVPSNVDGMRLW